MRGDDGCIVAVIVIALITIALFSAWVMGNASGRQQIRAEAVERGYGQYESDAHGNTTWKWSDEPTPKISD